MKRKLTALLAAAAFILGMMSGCSRTGAPRPSSSQEEVPESDPQGPVFIPFIRMRARMIPNLDLPDGTEGRFSVGDYTAALYGSTDDRERQRIVDDSDSAWYFPGMPGASEIIGDHNYQGFEEIYNAIPGETLAFLTFGDTTVSYVCVSVYRDCTNEDGSICLSDGRILQTDPGDGQLATYTCNDYTGRSVTVVFWEPMAVSVVRQ